MAEQHTQSSPAPERQNDKPSSQPPSPSPAQPAGSGRVYRRHDGSMYERPLPANPRIVRGGIKMAGKEGPEVYHWAGVRFWQMVKGAAGEFALTKGVEWAKRGQIRTLTFEPGAVVASVQGLETKAHRVTFGFDRLAGEQWERVVGAINDSASHAAKLLAGEMPEEIDELFESLGFRLFPKGIEEVRASVPTSRSEDDWDEHAVCVAAVVAERLSREPFLLLTLRGLPGEELVERLRQRRAATRSSRGFAPAYTPRLPPGVPVNPPPLDGDPARFWEEPEGLKDLDTTPGRLEVQHPLLRRLGPSPFTKGRFPLVGLLATCYDIAREGALREVETEVEEEAGGEDDDAV